MILGASIALLLLQASAPPAVEESELDLATRAPAVVHSISVTSEHPFQAAISNRVPAARYRVSKSNTVVYLEPYDRRGDVAAVVSIGPGCDEVVAAVNDVLRSADEAEVAARSAAAKALATRSSCPRAARGMEWLAGYTRGIGTSGSLGADEATELVVERIDASEKVLRHWKFRFAALGTWTTPVGWSAPNEATWFVRETVRDLAEIGAFARGGPRASLPKVEVAPVSGVPATFSVRVTPSSLPRTQTLVFTESVWTPKSYEGLARALVGGRGAAPPRQATPGPPVLEALTDPQASVLEREDRRLSQRLTAAPLDPALHEAAALLLASLALREAAGGFSDVRVTLSRLTAHLALAGAARAGAPPSMEGRFAELGRLTLLERQQDALAGLSLLTAATPAEAAWIKALRMRNTADWRILDQPLTATLLERLEYHRALAASIGGSQPLEAFRRRNQEAIPDWGRGVPVRRTTSGGSLAEVETRRPSVEAANVFVGPLLDLEVKEAIAVLGASRGREIPPAELVAALNTLPARVVTRDASQRLEVRVIGPGAWARFHQRHILSAIYQTVVHLRLLLALPEQADAFWGKSRGAFQQLELMPILIARVLNLPRGSAPPADERAVDAAIKAQVCAPAAGLWERAPERLTPWDWQFLSAQCSASASVALGHPERWFDPAMPPGTAFDYAGRSALSKNAEKGLPLLERLRLIAPHHKYIAASYFGLRYRWKGGPAEFDAVFAPLAEYDVGVMRKQAAYLEDDVERYRQAMTRVAAVDPEAWLVLGEYLAAHDRAADAAQAFEAAVDRASDRVSVANRVEWLILYYVDQDLEDKATALAAEGAQTGSAMGLLVMARLQERVGRWDAAERHYKMLVKRYGPSDELDTFSIRRDRSAGAGPPTEETRQAWARIFPNGRVKLGDAELQRPPWNGVEVVKSPASLERQGLVKGAVIVGRDGYRVENLAQYRALQSFSDDAPATLVVWRDGAYTTIVSTTPRPHPIITLQSYRAR